MKKAVIIGSGISGLSCAISCAEKGIKSILVSPFVSERSQSVLAAGGINAAFDSFNEGDSIESHIEDTLKGGRYIAGKKAVTGLCKSAPDIVNWLESLGTLFTRNDKGNPDQRAFGGQSHKRTCFCGASTGKQIVSSLVMEARKYESLGLIERRLWCDFYAALIDDGICYGAIIYNEASLSLEIIYADALVMAVGGQNTLFGKTTGSTMCDGFAAGKLFTQGVELKNLEFIQYHPTTIETAQKKMLISEAVRGEGGRLYYLKDGKRVYFMEERFGKDGNLMPRDVVSRCIYECKRDVFLDISFLGEDQIDKRIPEVRDLCKKYINLDISKESIKVSPSVHFFMGGIAVGLNHESSIKRLYAIGECASIYHGANRLGGNSLLAAIYSGKIAANDIENSTAFASKDGLFKAFFEDENKNLAKMFKSDSKFPVMYVRSLLAESMNKNLAISRNEQALKAGIEDISYYLSVVDKIKYDSSVLAYFNYSVVGILTLAKAILLSANERKESRGAHFRSDYPVECDDFKAASVVSYNGGDIKVRFDKEGQYEV